MSSLVVQHLPDHAQAWCARVFEVESIDVYDKASLNVMLASPFSNSYQKAIAIALSDEVIKATGNKPLTFDTMNVFMQAATLLHAPHCAMACEIWGARLAKAAGRPFPPIHFVAFMLHFACSGSNKISLLHRLQIVLVLRRFGNQA